MQRGEHAGVREPEVAKVVVRRMLAAEDCAGARHLCLDQRVADASPHRHPAVFVALAVRTIRTHG